MNPRDDALAALNDSGFLDVIKWAAPAAFAMTDELYSEDAGHDQGVVGYLNFKHLADLLDRATSNGRFALGEDVSGSGGDLVERGITRAAAQSMPRLSVGSVVRSDYQQSPGWAIAGYRVLLQSFKFGEIDQIVWARRSEAKRRVASQAFIAQPTLFDDGDFDAQFLAGVPGADGFDRVTLVAAHTFNPVTKEFELYVGQSRNPEHGDDACWHWRTQLLTGGGSSGNSRVVLPPKLPGDPASTEADDVAVRLRNRQANPRQSPANG